MFAQDAKPDEDNIANIVKGERQSHGIKIFERPDRLASHRSGHWAPRRVGWH